MRFTTLVLTLGISFLLCSAKAEKSNEEPAAARTKASKIRPARDPKAQLPPSGLTERADAASAADIPLFPQDEDQAADLNNGVTAKANIAASAAPSKSALAGSGSIAVSGDSRLNKGPTLAPAVEPRARDGDAIEVAAADLPVQPSFRGAPATAVADPRPQSPPVAAVAATRGPAKGQAPAGAAKAQAPAKQAAKAGPAQPPQPTADPGAKAQPWSAASGAPATADGLSRYFDEGEALIAADPASAAAQPAGGEEAATEDAQGLGAAGALIIGRASAPGSAASRPKTLADAIDSDGEIGGAVPKVNPWQSLVSLAAVLALIVALAAAVARLKRKGGTSAQRLNVIEEIGLGQGRQILIVEVMGDALVLGMTPQSINLLDKLPVDSFASDYRGSVDAILAREANQARRWSERPAFRSELRSALNVPRAAVAPSQQLSLGDLRRSRQPAAAVHSVMPLNERQGKAELIDRIREQLQRLED